MKEKALILLVTMVIFSVSCNTQKSGQNEQTADTLAVAPVTDYQMMIVAKLNVKPEKILDFTEVAKEMIELSNKESGCKSYQLFQDPYDNSKFVFVEEYINQAAVEAHFSTDYFKAFGPKITDMVAGPAEIKIVTVAKEVIQ